MQLYVGFWEYIHHYTFLIVKYCRGQLLASLHFIYKIYFSEKLKTVEEVHYVDFKEEYGGFFFAVKSLLC